MTAGTTIAEEEFYRAVMSFEYTAFRLELQPVYLEPGESEEVALFLAGEPKPPTEDVGYQEFLDAVAEATRLGKRIERVRVHEDPPNDYQRWERWTGGWNIAAGEVIRYMTRARAHEIGLLPAAGNLDWWLLDSNRLIVMRFDDHGHRIHTELVTEPAEVAQAGAWRDLAVHHSIPDPPRSAAD